MRGETHHTTVKRLLETDRYFKENPNGRISTGVWDDPEWDAAQFWQWFRECLNDKINREDTRQWRNLTPQCQLDLRLDVRAIRQYVQNVARSSGSRGMLRTPELKRRYPNIDNQAMEV